MAKNIPPPWAVLDVKIDITDDEVRETVNQTWAAMAATMHGPPLSRETVSIALPTAFLDVAAMLAKIKGTSREEVVRILASDALYQVERALVREITRAKRGR